MLDFSFKMGSRILSEDELKLSIPNYGQIFEQINMIREMSANANTNPQKYQCKSKSSNEFIREFGKDYNNIFSILGARGVGKTSIMLTIKNRIENMKPEPNNDIILPMIVPEDMGNVADVLGWIIRYLEDVYKPLEAELDKYYEKDEDIYKAYHGKFGDLYTKSKISAEYEELFKLYLLRKDMYGKIINDKFIGLLEYIDDNKKIVSYDQELMYKFKGFIGNLIELKKKVACTNKEPLIFIFFDDVDMEPERCPEVFSTILKYLTHHSIVVFVNGNYSTFHEEISIEYMKKESLINTPFLAPQDQAQSYIDSIKQRSHDYLKKVLPPSLRYEIPIFTDEEKARFRYTSNKEEKSNYKFHTFSELLEICFCTGLDEESNFLKLKGQFIYPYFKIFDETARGLINVYYYLFRMISLNDGTSFSLCNWNSSKLKQFLNTVIDSSTVLAKNKDIIKKVVKIFKEEDNNAIPFFIDYEFLEAKFDENNSEKEISVSSQVDVFDEIITLCLLAMFFEQSLIAINNAKDSKNKREIKIHGCRIFVKILNSQNKSEFKLYPYISDTRELVYLYYSIYRTISGSNIEFLFSDNQTNFFTMLYFKQLEAMNSLVAAGVQKYQSNSLMEYLGHIYSEDKQWVESRIKFIYKYGKTGNDIMEDIKEELFNKVAHVYEDSAFNESLYRFTAKDIFRDSYDNEETYYDIEYFKKYVEKIFEEFQLNDVHTRLKIGDLEKLLQQFIEVYLLADRIKIKKLCFEIIKAREADIELLIKPMKEEFKIYDGENLDEIIRIDEKLREIINQNTKFIENERRKALWNNLQERYIYMPYDTTNSNLNVEIYSIKKRGKKINYIKIAELNPNEYIEDIYGENSRVLKKFNSGVLYIKEDDILDDNTQEFLTNYFIAKEQNSIIKAYLFKGLKVLKQELSNLEAEFSKLSGNRIQLEAEIKDGEEQIRHIFDQILREKVFEQVKCIDIKKELTPENDYMQTIVYLNYYLYLNIEKRILGDAGILKTENLSQLIFMYENIIETERNIVNQSKEEGNIIISSSAMQTIYEINKLPLLNSVRMQIYNITTEIDNIKKNTLRQLLEELQYEMDRLINSGNTGETFNLNEMKQKLNELADLHNSESLERISSKDYVRKEMFLSLVEKSMYKYISVECYLELSKISSKDAMNYFHTERIKMEKYVKESREEAGAIVQEKNFGFLEYLKHIKLLSKSEGK